MAAGITTYQMILDQKNRWANATTQAEKDAAKKAAQTGYGYLDANEAARVKGMDNTQLNQYMRDLYANNMDASKTTIPGQTAPTTPNVTTFSQTAAPPLMGQQTPQTDPTTAMLGQWSKLMQEMMQGNAAKQKQMEEQARAQAQAQANAQRASWGSLISNLNNSKTGSLKDLDLNFESAQQDLEDRSFQSWLESRQNVADRGLAGSGIARGEDTRLLLGRGRQLANLERDKMSQAGQIERSYADRLGQAYAGMSSINEDSMYGQLLSQMSQGSNSQMMDVLKLYSDMIGTTIGYDRAKPGELLDYDLGMNKLNSDQQLAWAKLGEESKQFWAKLGQDYNVEMTKVMGVDSNGNPTLNALELAEQIRKNKVNEGLDAQRVSQGWANIDQNANELAVKLNEVQNKASEFTQSVKDSNYKNQANALNTIITSEGQNLRNIQTQMKSLDEGTQAYTELDKRYRASVTRYESAVEALSELAELGSYNAPTSNNSATQPTTGAGASSPKQLWQLWN